ncbi:hypothetical protein PpBr36_01255 [Pyricularia pennisetigena]|uniref:hypothetical protein n=1 Tax=Pyricularia pennisetigena TaxID=1578925 RepID=UPI0011523694|nr:hypothetical protein PpBr36_01255 [Pyricularia pennisetigena]TLS28616.1 hypothetical protein PpBr36_01255 [Pyricularia pennisetigena]
MPAGGTGEKLASALTAVAGVSSLVATILSVISIFFQTVPLYSIASWLSMISLKTAAFVDPIRDVYEAFTIYTFFQLLINYLGGERALIIMTHGREPVEHLWPMNYVMSRVDISDPYSFLAIKRGILQYAWLKPTLALAAVIMKATGTYKEGYLGVDSGYFWSGLVYNVSMTICLYCLALFWVCMHDDLKPFRPVPKFLCIKLIIFASYWQGFFLSILVWLGAITDKVEGYSPDNLAAAIQDFLICIEMPIFAIAHWYAFSWHDFANDAVEEARMPVKFALRDSFGIRDLIEDSKETFKGDKYGYRGFDSRDKIMAHESSKSRLARVKAGMRYERGGKGKYWIPSPGEITSDVNPYTPLLGGKNGNGGGRSDSPGGPSRTSSSSNVHEDTSIIGDDKLDPEEELLYDKARKLEYGDWNYPVIIANVPRKPWETPRPSPQSGRSRASLPAPSSLSVNGSGPKQRDQRQDSEGTVVAKKSKGKGKGKSRATAHSGRSTPPRETPQPAVESQAKPDLSEVDFDVSKMSMTDENNTNSVAPQSESNHWEHESEPAVISPKYDIDEEDMRNVWGGNDEPGRETHL